MPGHEKTSRLIRSGQIHQPVSRSKGQKGMLQAIDHSVAGSMTAQPPGSCLSALRVAAHSQQVAPSCRCLIPLQRCSWCILQPQLTGWTILQIWPPATTGCLQDLIRMLQKRDLAPMKKWYLKLKHILRPKTYHSTKKVSPKKKAMLNFA